MRGCGLVPRLDPVGGVQTDHMTLGGEDVVESLLVHNIISVKQLHMRREWQRNAGFYQSSPFLCTVKLAAAGILSRGCS